MNHPSLKGRRVTIVGNRGGTNIGGSFERAGQQVGLNLQIMEPREAMNAPKFVRYFNWHLRGRRPTWLTTFSSKVAESSMQHESEALLVTGIAPVTAGALELLRKASVKVANYLTDDPFNEMHKAPWFLKSLPNYFSVFSPRRANLDDLRRAGCAHVEYLPFGYDPELHFPEAPAAEDGKVGGVVLFVGGADADRIPICKSIADADLPLAIYGDYWDRYAVTRPYYRGYADLATLRKATTSAAVCLCLTRKANRDGHTMRSYEIPAMRGLILAEETDDHREMFGDEGDCALFFRGTSEMVDKAKWLLGHQEEGRQMADRAYTRITGGKNTYGDRLETILDTCLNR